MRGHRLPGVRDHRPGRTGKRGGGIDISGPVDLSETEKLLHDEIVWDIASTLSWDHAARLANLDRIGRLARSLIGRKAIPAVRLAYFTDPDLNAGGHGNSRRDVFERNGTAGDAILSHPHFAKYLLYFIHGPDLLPEVVAGFVKILDDDAGTSGEVLDQIRAYVRRQVRDRGMEPGHAAEEFFKLAHEVGRDDLAESVRAAAKRVKA